MKLRMLFPACLLVASASAFGHGPSPHDRFCSGGQPVVVAQFNYTPSQLQEYAACLADPLNSCTAEMPPNAGCPLETCGEFDDDYGVANRLAYNYCATFAMSSSGNGIGSTRADVEGPPQYFSAAHHLDYSFSGSLYGSCLRCAATPYNSKR
jgi:hypothetical protein